MRRGHPRPGWRNDGPRHFRPRLGGPPPFRPPRGYNATLLDNPRFPITTHHRGFGNRFPPPAGAPPPQNDNQVRPYSNQYQAHNRPGPHDEQHGPNRSYGTPHPRGPRPHDNERHYGNRFDKPLLNEDQPQMVTPHNYQNRNVNYNAQSHEANPMFERRNEYRHRDTSHHNIQNYDQHPPAWACDNQPQRPYDRNTYRHRNQEEAHHDTAKPPEFSGHRPPASDHYNNQSTTVDDSNAFSRSVDDTVDIIGRRLMNRNDPQSQPPEYPQHQGPNRINASDTDDRFPQNTQPEIPRRKTQKCRQVTKSNCDKIKNKIVHQLLKMDKDRIHKLMDNPNSSTKFEYAINSLITESQNSLNRHLRLAAEQSLIVSQNDISTYNENDSVYEDTFMRQMQCILEPQETVMLEDIKPFVLAELNKVLQIDNLDLLLDANDSYNPDYPTQGTPYREKDETDYMHQEHPTYSDHNWPEHASPDYDRQYDRKYGEASHRHEIEPDHEPKFNPPRDDICDNDYGNSPNKLPVFDPNAEQLSEEEYPFAELDRQYHVAVHHNFIDDVEENVTSSCHTPDTQNSKILNTPSVKNETPDLISPTKLNPTEYAQEVLNNKSFAAVIESDIKKELLSSADVNEFAISKNHKTKAHLKEELPKPDSSSTLKITPVSSKSRKRSMEQRPSHRKEKRKKSESSSHYDTQSSHESSSKSSHYSHGSKDRRSSETSKYNKKKEGIETEYSNKYVKRKDSHRRSDEKDSKRRYSDEKRKSRDKESKPPKNRTNSTSSNHSMTSPNTYQANKNDNNKLKTFDIFTEQPRKPNTYQAHRNTATTPVVEEKNKITPPKSKETVTKEITKKTKETQTTISKSSTSRFSQTDASKTKNKLIQTDPVAFEKKVIKATDAFERMKEIDMEIQVLLREKFKLYSTLENKDHCSSSLNSLGMTVLNVSEIESAQTSAEDSIVEDFTSIPANELEEIALETIDIDKNSPVKTRSKRVVKPPRRSPGPKVRKRPTRTRGKAPNISLIEQIITDDRPLEDIISLEDLERSPVRTRTKKQKPKSKTYVISDESDDEALIVEPKLPEVKECKVVLIREDLSKYLHKVKVEIAETKPIETKVEHVVESPPIAPEPTIIGDQFQVDMLDISEDIVIEEICDKSDEKIETVDVPLPEEMVLDNSQSGDDTESTKVINVDNNDSCKVYDYSIDNELKDSTITVAGHGEAVLAVECVDNNILAACLDGNVYYFGSDGLLLTTLRGSNLAVTCLIIVKEKYSTTVYTGSLDSRIRCYDLDNGLEKSPECNVLSPIQSMDRAWDTVFVGTRTGYVLQFECKNNMLIPVSTIKFSEQSILALRALKEGPRKVLLVAARSESVCLKDAQTGLLLRTLSGPKMTVYTLLYEDGKVYCGTSSNHIQVFDYSCGSHIFEHEGGKGAVCLRYASGLLFAGCYDGCVYVFRSGQLRPMAQLRGPNVMLLSMAVVGNKVIVGYKDRSFFIWTIPETIMQEMIL